MRTSPILDLRICRMKVWEWTKIHREWFLASLKGLWVTSLRHEKSRVCSQKQMWCFWKHTLDFSGFRLSGHKVPEGIRNHVPMAWKSRLHGHKAPRCIRFLHFTNTQRFDRSYLRSWGIFFSIPEYPNKKDNSISVVRLHSLWLSLPRINKLVRSSWHVQTSWLSWSHGESIASVIRGT